MYVYTNDDDDNGVVHRMIVNGSKTSEMKTTHPSNGKIINAQNGEADHPLYEELDVVKDASTIDNALYSTRTQTASNPPYGENDTTDNVMMTPNPSYGEIELAQDVNMTDNPSYNTSYSIAVYISSL